MTTTQKALTTAAIALAATAASATPADDKAAVAALDTAYQAAVERNDADAMAKILHPEFILVVGRGAVFTRAQLLESARTMAFVYDKQVEMPGTQTVRLFEGKNGKDTAIVTALLWIKALKTDDKTTVEKKLWFSDTYVRTADGWKYAFGQASLALPPEAPKP